MKRMIDADELKEFLAALVTKTNRGLINISEVYKTIEYLWRRDNG